MDIIAAIDKAGVVGVLVLLIITGARQMWVFGWQYKQVVKERDQWKYLALRGTKFLELSASRIIHHEEDS